MDSFSVALTNLKDAIAQARITKLEALYGELLTAVGKKTPGETRHQTALRYIQQAERPNNDPTQQAHKREQS
jgi:hypothetical protein